MFPARWVKLDGLPLLPNGKVDFAALPEPRESRQEKAREDIPEEVLVTDIWQDALRHRDFGPHDHFFELGGDSIKAIQVVGRLQRAGYPIDMRSFLDAPTVAALAARMKEATRAPDPTPSDQGPAIHVDLSNAEIEELYGR